MLFFWPTPSMKTLTWSKFCEPAWTLVLPLASALKATPGARSTLLRKLRLTCGSASIMRRDTSVPTSEPRTFWRCDAPVMTICCASLTRRSTEAVSPTVTVTVWVLASLPGAARRIS